MQTQQPPPGRSTAELADVGEAPFNGLKLSPVAGMATEGMTANEFLIELGKSSPAGLVKRPLAEALGITPDGIILGYEGGTLDDTKTISENGIVELGSVARKRGARLEIKFTLGQAVELPGERERRLEKEREEEEKKRKLLQEQEKKQKELEEAERIAAQKRAEEETAAASAQNDENRCRLRCAELGTTAGVELVTNRTHTIAQFLAELRRAIGIPADAPGHPVIMMGGEVVDPGGGRTLQQAGIGNQTELFYYWSEGGGGGGGGH